MRLILTIIILIITQQQTLAADSGSNEIIPASHNLGIGHLSPNEKLTVNGSISFQNLSSAPSTNAGFGKLFSNGNILYYRNGNGAISNLLAGDGAPEWTENSGALHPADSSGEQDVLIGGTTAGAADIILDNGGNAVFNEQGKDKDLRVEASGQGDALFVQGSDGYIGMGTETPNQHLHIHRSGANTTLHLTNHATGSSSSDGFDLQVDGSSHAYVWNREPSSLYFGTNGAARMAITSPGNVGVADSTPNYLLDIAGDLRIQAANRARFGGTGSGDYDSVIYSSSNNLYITNERENGDIFIQTRDGSVQNSLVVNGSSQNIGIGTTSTSELLSLEGAIALDELGSTPSATSGYGKVYVSSGNSKLYFRDDGGTIYNLTNGTGSTTEWTENSGALHPADNSGEQDVLIGGTTAGAADIILDNGGNATFNEQGKDKDFRIEGVDQGNALVVEGSSANVGIGISTPRTILHVHRSGAASPTIHLTNTTTGSLASDGFSLQADGSGNAYVWNREATNSYFGTNNSTRMTISSAGNIGAGTTNPTALLHVHQPSAATAITHHTNTSTGSLSTDGFDIMIDTSGNAYAWNREAGDMYFGTNNSNRMTILSGGNVGVGVTPTQKLHVGAEGDWLRMGERNALTQSFTNYSTNGYKLIQVADLSTANDNISLGADLTANTSGSFTGRNIFLANNSKMIAQNNGDTGYVGVLRVGNDDKLHIGGGGTNTGEEIVVDTANNNVGINTASPGARFHVAEAGANATWFGSVAGNASNWAHVIGLPNASGVMTIVGGGDTGTAADRRHNLYGSTEGGSISVYDNGGSVEAIISGYSYSYFNGGNLGVGTLTPNEILTIEGAISIDEQASPPSNTSGFGKLYVDSDNSKLYFVDDGGTPYNLTNGTSSTVEWTESSGALHPADNSGEQDILIGGTSAGAADIILDNGGNATFNEQGKDKDLRVEASGQGNALFVEGSTANVGVGISTPRTILHVHRSGATSPTVHITNTTTGSLAGDGLSMQVDGSGHAYFWNREATNSYFGTNNSTRMTMLSGGNVGVGVTNPNALFHVNEPSAGTGTIHLTNNSIGTLATDGFSLQADTSGHDYIINQESANIYFGTNATTRMTLTSAGNLGIGDPSPGALLEVAKSGSNATWFGSIAGNGSGWAHVYGLPNASGIMTIVEGGDTGTAADRRHNIYGNTQGGSFSAYDNGGTVNATISGFSDSFFTGGNLGVGDNTPNYLVDVAGDIRIQSTNRIRFGGTGSGDYDNVIYSASDDFYITNERANQDIFFRTSDGTVQTSMVINGSSQKVGIGTTATSEVLSVEGAIALDELGAAPSSTSGYGKIYVASGNSRPYFVDDGGTIHNLTNNGATSIDELSDGITDSNNLFMGTNSGTNFDGGPLRNTAIGHNTMPDIDDNGTLNGDSNTAVGFDAGKSLVYALGNTLIGEDAGENLTNAQNNVTIGINTLQQATDQAHFNYAGGVAALKVVRNAMGNISIGHQSMEFCYNGDNNVALGYRAGRNVWGGNGNILIGYDVDTTFSAGSRASNNIIIGNDISFSSTADGFLNIANMISGDIDNGSVVIGSIASCGASWELCVQGDQYTTNGLAVGGVLYFASEESVTSGATVTVNWEEGNRQVLTLAHDNITLNFTDPTNASNLTLIITQDGTGSRDVTTWDTDIKWPSGVAPNLTDAASSIDVISCLYRSSPKMYLCTPSLDFQ